MMSLRPVPSSPVTPGNAGFLSMSPEANSTPKKRIQRPNDGFSPTSPDKENVTGLSPNESLSASPSPSSKVAKSRFFQSPKKKSDSSPGSPGSDSFSSPTTGSAEKKLRTITLLTPPDRAPAAAALSSSTAKPRASCDLRAKFDREAGIFAMDEISNEEIPSLRDYQKSLSTVLTTKQIAKIRFSQNSINDVTSSDETVETLIDSLSTKGWGKGKAGINIVEMPDGKYTSLDNRRLYCAKKALKKNPKFELPVTIYRYSDLESGTYYKGIARDLASSPRKADLEALTSNQRLAANTWGYCVYMRMRVLSQKLPAEESYGYTKLPTVRKES